MAKAEDKPVDEPVVTQGYTKSQITDSKRFTGQRDILNGLLEDGKTYTIEEVESITKTFLGKEVK
ncbi:hypothetical protein [Paenibacillus macquariensis]|uniref:Phage protein n=1 Tax=Paenibacillus macquariensis TaxID=948756 RepID=A0ABY1JXG2_9BACL|nr:hypothetical protein [Paenibacillus macquariensis]MEC0089332.1 hypothetical protein [Paenibacillus macquariensis]OAB33266.1 hypothetical protein PMSM_14735 [Paenibacillus macquariensis subsp. macquariensis]SIQ93618.1 hypothetical protein SAMN05421578_105126 [Paenibacillus macquariensis]